MRLLLLPAMLLSLSSFALAGDPPAGSDGTHRHEQVRAYLRDHPEAREKLKEWLKAHPEARGKIREWLQAHPEAREKLKARVRAHLGNIPKRANVCANAVSRAATELFS